MRLRISFLAFIVALAGASFFSVTVTAPPALAAGLSDPGALTVHNGGMTVTDDGAVIENLEIRGTLRIEASNVLVRNVWVYAPNTWTVYVASGSARFENMEIGNASVLGSRGIGGNNVVGVGLYIHHVEDGIKLGSNSTYAGVVVKDLASPNASPHTDAVQVEGAVSNSTVRNSVLSSLGSRGLGNASVIVKSDFGPQSNITFANNYMNGGNYTVFVRDGGNGVPSNITFSGNRFGTSHRYGLSSLDGPVNWENNTWAETGELIDASGNVIGQAATTTTQAESATTTTKAPSSNNTPKATTTSVAAATTTSTSPAPTGPENPQLTVDAWVGSTTIPETTTTTEDWEFAAAAFAEPPPPPPSGGGVDGWKILLVATAGGAVLLGSLASMRAVQDRRSA